MAGRRKLRSREEKMKYSFYHFEMKAAVTPSEDLREGDLATAWVEMLSGRQCVLQRLL